MKQVYIVLVTVLFFFSCGTKKAVTSKKTQRTKTVVTKPIIKKDTPEVYANATEEYIAIFSDKAQDEMRQHGIPASITLAQGILESGSGKGRLAKEGNNHFGIKCHTSWKGAKIYHDDDSKGECFRKYRNALQSFDDHSNFLVGRKRYATLFTLSKTDYKNWSKELRKAGYATDRKYPQKLISLIERYQLYRFDQEVLGVEDTVNEKHIVAAGDTLYSLSKRYGITVDVLKSLNGLDSNELFVGQALFVKPLPKD
jgi:flagellum-specific peptidoglycan hydrolase FlgJ